MAKKTQEEENPNSEYGELTSTVGVLRGSAFSVKVKISKGS